MPESISQFVHACEVIDVHEHHMPEIALSRDVNLLKLFQQSYAAWTSNVLPSEPKADSSMISAAAEPTSWEALAPFLENSGSNAFVRNLVGGIADLYGVDEITRENWEAVDASVRLRHKDAKWPGQVIERAAIKRIVTDPFLDPLLNPRPALGENYDAVLRINAFAFGWHPESHDHNGNSGHALLRRLGMQVKTFDDYCAAIRELVTGCARRNQIALKNALAYDRNLSFDEPNEELARQAWGQMSPSPAARKAFSDFVVDLFCQLAGEADLPVQTHLGTAIISGSHPLRIAGLIERHPRTRFLLMHLAYPWSRDLLGMAFAFRNVWLDLCWSFLLSPSHFKLALHEAIEVMPDDSRLMLGGDCLHVEETFAAIQNARQLVGEVLSEKIAGGYFRFRDAERLAVRILCKNASEFFGLS
ncbi:MULTISPECIES: amidohydrolase family protein [Bradyrhizobium]|uniref:amidohydrolase family protein n=1 Tax=Bradyrhizobium TaxID=374 RepID=UPI0021AAD69A|nr:MULTISPECIES: amidohydrolase [Bradyrhizobium]MDF0492989.1 amidohydrolase [Bradyrhizobium yuanmingense]UWU67724.1 amidohydrolase [Bradyrhizobium sp. NC92]